MTNKKFVGIYEDVIFPEFGIDVIAKMDTGSYSGTLHATRIHQSEESGQPVLSFSAFGNHLYRTTDFEIKSVRSSNGIQTGRYFVNTKITIHGKDYPITLSLFDRSDMKWPVLIGRKFLRENNFVIDPTKRKE